MQNIEMERALLARLLCTGSAAFMEMTDGLSDESFTTAQYRLIYSTMRQMAIEGLDVTDYFALSDRISQGSRTGISVDATQIMSLAAESNPLLEVRYYVRRLEDMYRRRKTVETLQSMQREVENPSRELDETIGSGVDAIIRCTRYQGMSITTMHDMFSDIIQRTMLISSGQVPPGIPTGFPQLDRLGGFHTSDLIVIGAETSRGKTSLALSIAMNSALKTGEKMMIFTLEMSPMQISARMLSHETGFSAARMLNMPLSQEETERMDRAMNRLDEPSRGILIDRRSNITAEYAESTIRQLHLKQGIRLFFIDYLQTMPRSREKGETDEACLGRIIHRMKDLARSLDVCIVVMSQLNRPLGQSSSSPLPQINRLRASGEIEEAADLILLIHRHLDDDEALSYPRPFEWVSPHGTAIIRCAKDRNGNYGGVHDFVVGFDAPTAHFYPLEQIPRAGQARTTSQDCPW